MTLHKNVEDGVLLLPIVESLPLEGKVAPKVTDEVYIKAEYRSAR